MHRSGCDVSNFINASLWRLHMKKKITHYNFDTRQSYESKYNQSILNETFANGSFDIPLWGTKEQFEKNGLEIKKGEEPVKCRIQTEENGFQHYRLYNFSQTSGEGLYWSYQ